MKLLVKEIHITKPPGKSWAVPLVGALLIAVLCQPVAAVEQDLLDVGASGWVPLEQFTVFKVNPNDWEKPENFSGKDQKTAEASQNETTPPAAEPSPAGAPAQPALKPLSRSLNLPIMPGLNKDAASDPMNATPTKCAVLPSNLRRTQKWHRQRKRQPQANRCPRRRQNPADRLISPSCRG